MTTTKKPGLVQLRVAAGKFYKLGRNYKRGDVIVWPREDKPSILFEHANGDKIELDKNGCVIGGQSIGKQHQNVNEIQLRVKQLAKDKKVDELQELCYELGLDANGTKVDLAGRYIKYLEENPDDDPDKVSDDDDKSDGEGVRRTAAAT